MDHRLPGPLAQLGQLCAIVSLRPGSIAPCWIDLFLRHHQIEVELDDVAESMAHWTCAEWIVERKHLGCGARKSACTLALERSLNTCVRPRESSMANASHPFEIGSLDRIGEPCRMSPSSFTRSTMTFTLV